jgi:hypothetical protein
VCLVQRLLDEFNNIWLRISTKNKEKTRPAGSMPERESGLI